MEPVLTIRRTHTGKPVAKGEGWVGVKEVGCIWGAAVGGMYVYTAVDITAATRVFYVHLST